MGPTPAARRPEGRPAGAALQRRVRRGGDRVMVAPEGMPRPAAPDGAAAIHALWPRAFAGTATEFARLMGCGATTRRVMNRSAARQAGPRAADCVIPPGPAKEPRPCGAAYPGSFAAAVEVT